MAFTSWTVLNLFILVFKNCDSVNGAASCEELNPPNTPKWVSVTPGRCIYGEYDITVTFNSDVIVIHERLQVNSWADAVDFCLKDHPDAFLYVTSSTENELDTMSIGDLVQIIGQDITLMGSEHMWQACHYTGSRWECLDHTDDSPHYWQSSTNFEGFWRWSGGQPSGAYAASGCLVVRLTTGLMEAHDCNDNSATSPLIICAIDLYNDTTTTTATDITTSVSTELVGDSILIESTTETSVMTTTPTQSTTVHESTESLNSSRTFKMATSRETFTTKSTSSNFGNLKMHQRAVLKEDYFIAETGGLCPQFYQPNIPIESVLKCASLCVSEQVYCASFNFILTGEKKLCQLNYQTGIPNDYHPPGQCIFYSRE